MYFYIFTRRSLRLLSLHNSESFSERVIRTSKVDKKKICLHNISRARRIYYYGCRIDILKVLCTHYTSQGNLIIFELLRTGKVFSLSALILV